MCFGTDPVYEQHLKEAHSILVAGGSQKHQVGSIVYGWQAIPTAAFAAR